MKKLLFLTTLVLTSLTTFAQGSNDKLPDGIMSLEWRYNPFDYEGKPVNMAQFYGRLFLNNKSVVRLGVGVGFDRDKQVGIRIQVVSMPTIMTLSTWTLSKKVTS